MQQDADFIDLKRLYFILRRNILLIVVVTAAFFSAALAYVTITPELYTAQTRLLLDKGITDTLSEISSVRQMGYDIPALESEVEVLRSKSVASLVLEDKKVAPYLVELRKKYKSDEAIIEAIAQDLNVRRIEQTYVLTVRYTSTDPQRAADFANAFAEAYIKDQFMALSKISTRTESWLEAKTQDIKSNLDKARQKVQDYRARYNKMRQLKSTSPEDDLQLGTLRGLEKEVETYDSLYNQSLEQMETLSLQGAMPITHTRIISPATPPLTYSHPKTTLILAVAFVFGLGFAAILALIRDNFDKTLKRAGQVKRELGIAFLGFLPVIRKSSIRPVKMMSNASKEYIIGLYSDVMDKAFSVHSDTVRGVKNAIDLRVEHEKKKCPVIGISSVFPRDGAHDIAANLSAFIGHSDKRVLLIDGNIRSTTPLRSEKKMSSAPGLGAVIIEGRKLEDVILKSTDSALDLLPSNAEDTLKMLSRVNTQKIKDLVQACQKNYDYIIIDMPPMVAQADTGCFAEAVDYFILVAEWGKSQPNMLDFYLKLNNIDAEKIIGLVLARANMRKLKKFYGHKL